MGFFRRVSNIFEQYPIIVIALAIFLLLPLGAFAILTTAKTGNKTVCKYNHIVTNKTKRFIVFRWNADTIKVHSRTVTCAAHKRSEILTRKAKEALDRGDKKRAESLQKMAEGALGTLAANSEKSSKNEGDLPFISGELIGFIPKELEGYTMVEEQPGMITASKMYSADSKAHPGVKLLTIELSQMNKESVAKQWIKQNIELNYSADSKETSFNGIPAYFGTYDGEYAILAYQINGVVFKIEMLSSAGSPKELFEEILKVGARVP